MFFAETNYHPAKCNQNKEFNDVTCLIVMFFNNHFFLKLIFLWFYNSSQIPSGPPAFEIFQATKFHCGEPVNETIYDNLNGIANRKAHPLFEEPEVSLIFKKNEIEEPDFKSIERNLQRSLEEVQFMIIVVIYLLREGLSGVVSCTVT